MSNGSVERQPDALEREHFTSSRLVVKIGSNALVEGAVLESPLNYELIDNIARQCSELFKAGVQVAIVSSGAVACGRNLLTIEEHSTQDRQIEALYGQPSVIEAWVASFRKYGVIAGQMLITGRDLNVAKRVLRESLNYGVVIVNINDPVSAEAVDDVFTLIDNDSTAHIVALAIEADTVLALTNVDGVFGHNGKVIEDGFKIDGSADFGENSDKGTGGMETKVGIMCDLAYQGIKGVIARAGRKDIILDVARGNVKGCTIFVPK